MAGGSSSRTARGFRNFGDYRLRLLLNDDRNPQRSPDITDPNIRLGLQDRIPTARDRHHTGGVIASVPSLKAEIVLQGSGTAPPNHGAIVAPSSVGNDRLTLALDNASTGGAIVIAAAGNYGRNTGSPLISRHSGVPVASCDERRTTDAHFGLRGIDRAATCLRPLRYQSQLQQRE